MTIDVKHEACEQFFLSVGKCFVIEAFLEFFQMADTKQKPTQNNLNFAQVISDAQKKTYILNTLDKFIAKYILVNENVGNPPFGSDEICQYAVNVIKSFIILTDFKDAVSTGNGEHLSTLHKQLLVHFFFYIWLQ